MSILPIQLVRGEVGNNVKKILQKGEIIFKKEMDDEGKKGSIQKVQHLTGVAERTGKTVMMLLNKSRKC